MTVDGPFSIQRTADGTAFLAVEIPGEDPLLLEIDEGHAAELVRLLGEGMERMGRGEPDLVGTVQVRDREVRLVVEGDTLRIDVDRPPDLRA